MNYYDQIKSLFICNEVYKKVKDYSKRRNEVETYYNVGRILFDAQNGEKRAKYGSSLIKEYSKRLIKELNDKKYSYRNLMNMRKFYIVFQDSKVNALRSQLSWSHYRELITLKDNNEIIYYIKLAIDNNLGYRELTKKIKNNDYNRLPNEYKDKITKNEEKEVKNEGSKETKGEEEPKKDLKNETDPKTEEEIQSEIKTEDKEEKNTKEDKERTIYSIKIEHKRRNKKSLKFFKKTCWHP